MRCHECKGTYRTRKGTLRMPDDDVGLLVIPDVEYLECDECGGQMYPLATAKKIGDTRDRTISERLGSGWIRVKALIENHVDRKKSVRIPNLLVDTGSQHTWLPEIVLGTIGVRREKKAVSFVMANGTRVTRSVGFVIVRVEKSFTIDEAVFAKEGDLALLGARTLEGLNLTVNRTRKRLVASGPKPAV